MPSVSAAILVLAGAIMIAAGSMSTALNEEARRRVVVWGYRLCLAALVAWGVAFLAELSRIAR
jgi:drug/metabolite transporter (DMT)-like permease